MLFGRKVVLTCNGSEVTTEMTPLNRQTVYVRADNGIAAAEKVPTASATGSPFVNFVNAELGGKKVTILLENPKGVAFQESVQGQMLKRAFPTCENVKDIKLTYK